MPRTGSTTDEPDDIEQWIHGLRAPSPDEAPVDDRTEPDTAAGQPAPNPGAHQQ
ncbi:hypothetical protein [Micromonospora sp. NPDC047730]|uniref:hypothetical protein n=1 Tax=Micromonospora sp. NPDC047730 TaxID=3364253 RepID=UPI0037155B18